MSPKKTSRGPQSRGRTPERKPVPVVCVEASAGGLEAFTRFLGTLPPDIGMAFIIIQHLDPSHPGMLPPLLAKTSPLRVREARHGTSNRQRCGQL